MCAGEIDTALSMDGWFERYRLVMNDPSSTPASPCPFHACAGLLASSPRTPPPFHEQFEDQLDASFAVLRRRGFLTMERLACCHMCATPLFKGLLAQQREAVGIAYYLGPTTGDVQVYVLPVRQQVVADESSLLTELQVIGVFREKGLAVFFDPYTGIHVMPSTSVT